MKKNIIPRWDPSKLPFLEEKLIFRKKHIVGASRSGVVLCVYAGEEARLTNFYAENFKQVYAVDKTFEDVELKYSNIVKIEMKDTEFIKNIGKVGLPKEIEILDLDPYGSPMQFLRSFFGVYDGTIKRIIMTDGAMTNMKVRRKINVYKYYRLYPNKTIVPSKWHYHHFACIVFSAVKEIVQDVGYKIVFFDYEYNRYKTAIYARFDLERIKSG